jgi:hypothetical protein
MSSASFRGPRRLGRHGSKSSRLRRVSGASETPLVEAELVSLDIAWEALGETAAPRPPVAAVLAPSPMDSAELLTSVIQSAWTEAQHPTWKKSASNGEVVIRHRISPSSNAASIPCAPAARTRPTRAPAEIGELGLPHERRSSGALAIIVSIALAAMTFYMLTR